MFAFRDFGLAMRICAFHCFHLCILQRIHKELQVCKQFFNDVGFCCSHYGCFQRCGVLVFIVVVGCDMC